MQAIYLAFTTESGAEAAEFAADCLNCSIVGVDNNAAGDVANGAKGSIRSTKAIKLAKAGKSPLLSIDRPPTTPTPPRGERQ